MSVMVENDDGWIIDQGEAVRKALSGCCVRCSQGDSNTQMPSDSGPKFQLLPALFEIFHPFRMDSHFNRVMKQKLDSPDSIEERPRKRKRKSSDSNNSVEKSKEGTAVTLDESQLREKFCFLLSSAHKVGLLQPLPCLPDNNNVSARTAARITGAGDSLVKLCTDSLTAEPDMSALQSLDPLRLGPTVFSKGGSSSGEYCLRLPNVLVNRHVEYSGCRPIMVEFMNEKYLLPPHSAFVLSSFHHLLQRPSILEVPGGYDLIVLDPPWHNKSVRRKHSYRNLGVEDLAQLPLQRLGRPGCLVVVWVTNSPQLLTAVQSRLLPAWGAQLLDQWTWVKMTTSGEMVCDLEAPKKPYEVLMIGRMEGAEVPEWPKDLKNRILVSVPCSLHSSKPSLAEVLKSILPPSPRCLELFARNLWADWTSWGNEVLRHQHMDFYQRLLPAETSSQAS